MFILIFELNVFEILFNVYYVLNNFYVFVQRKEKIICYFLSKIGWKYWIMKFNIFIKI